MNFQQLDNKFRSDDFPAIENDERGIRFLKLRSMSRRDALEEFCEIHRLKIEHLQPKEYLQYVFEQHAITEDQINDFLNLKYQADRETRLSNQDYLVDQLCRLQHFDWGGSYGNSLEKNIVNNYVKKIQSYSRINEEIDGSLLASMRGYTLSSWYNHWSSILIEDLFKDHPAVLPTIGLVKKIDFFIHDIPFDLKVTYFPAQLLASKLRDLGFGNELTRLKRTCRELNIYIPEDIKGGALKTHLFNKVSQDPRKSAKDFMEEYKQSTASIISEAEANPGELKKWFYENQGEARFDASNRFFLVLTDENDLASSWRLKRNIVFLRERIHSHLDNLSLGASRLETEFYWHRDQKTYRCKSDILFLNN